MVYVVEDELVAAEALVEYIERLPGFKVAGPVRTGAKLCSGWQQMISTSFCWTFTCRICRASTSCAGSAERAIRLTS